MLVAAMLSLTPKSSAAFVQLAYEIAYNEIPVSPVINIAHDIVETGKTVLSVVSQVTTLAVNIKQSVDNLLVAVNSILSSLGVNINFGNRVKLEGVVCNAQLDKINTSQLAIKMRDVFLVYRKSYQRDLVSEKRRQFYIDNIYNMYALVKAIQSDMSDNGEIGAAIIKTRGCAEGGATAMQACGITGQADTTKGSSEDSGESVDSGNSEIVQMYGYATNTLNDVVRVWERVAALKAQFRALQAFVGVTISPKYDYSDNKDISYLHSVAPDTAVYNYYKHNSMQLASAQVVYKEAPTSSLKETVVPDTEEDIETIEDNVDTSGLGLHFSASVPNSDGVSPLVENAEKIDSYGDLEDVENVAQKAANAHNFVIKLAPYRTSAEQYKKMLAQYVQKLALVVKSDNCGIDYTGRYFKSAEKTWSGQKFNANNISNYDDRKGITGWAIDAYDVAKAAQTSVTQDEDGNVDYSNGSSFGAEDVESETLSNDEYYDVKDGENWEKSESKSDELNEGADDGSKMSATSLHKTQDENRNASLISWQIGAEAAKLLGADPQKWGTPTGRNMVWNDTKVFYKQYINRKYQNIKAYLKRYTKEDVLDIFISKLQNAILDINQTDYQNELKEQRIASTTDIINALAMPDEDNSGIDEALLKKKDNLVKRIDSISEEIKSIKDEISDVSSQSEDAAQQAMLDESNKSADFSEDSQQAPKKTKDYSDVQEELSSRTNQGLITGNFEALKAKQKVLTLQRDEYNKELEALEKTIKLAKLRAQEENFGVARNKKNAAVAQSVNSFMSKASQAYSAYKSAVEGRFDTALAVVALGNPEAALAIKVAIEEASEEIVDGINSAIDATVNSTVAKLYALGDNLYLPSSSAQVEAIHQEMIDQLKALTITKSVVGYSIEGMIAFAELETLDTSPESEGFFVGALPRARDLKAPHPLNNYSQPPVREVFHFDSIDFSNLKPYNTAQYNRYKQLKKKLDNPLVSEDKKDEIRKEMRGLMSISRKDFLSLGNDTPKIWQEMLKDNAFIETQFILSDALNQGCETAAFLRGGIFPCHGAGSDVVLDINVIKKHDDDSGKDVYSFDMDDDEYMIRKDIKANQVPECMFIKMVKGTPYHAMWYDSKHKKGKVNTPSFLENVTSDGDPAERNCQYSELGMILDADQDNNTFFKSTVYETFNNSLAADDKDEDDMNDKDKNQMSLARHAELSRNQIGDFLVQMEQEKKFKQSLDKMKEDYDKNMEELKNKLQEFGFTVSDDYDIAKDSDYNLTVSRLKEVQAVEIRNTLSAINQVNVKDNNVAQKRIATIKQFLDIMEKDQDCVMEVSLVSASDNNLTEELKTAKANKEANDKFNKKVKEGTDEEASGVDYAYCSNY